MRSGGIDHPSRLLKKSASVVLASLRGSTYRSVRLTSSLAAAALDCLFDQPAPDSEPIGDRWLSYISTGQQSFVSNRLLSRNRLDGDRYALACGKMDLGGEQHLGAFSG